MKLISNFTHDKRGATAIEFALLSIPFIWVIMFALFVALLSYFNNRLEYATSQAARQILLGNVQSQTPAATLASFTQSVCDYLPKYFCCSNVIVNLYIVKQTANPGGYYEYISSNGTGLSMSGLSTGSGQFSLGTQGQYQYLQVLYPITVLPSGLASWLSGGVTYNGKAAYVITATAAFRVEKY